ncbi:sigma-70 family RNA polymerase sigma factor [Anoxybacterium hadale]|uniref:Sigma-70 family RNA polymerase sigma factor n=1 Tax=Anoxybacterium hadale TaxID=3408580 RepID=A0ACD1AD46_9FIRM|nr:sigma-70 family RNA polymerase sigma factor [Clostridiales bacterium]
MNKKENERTKIRLLERACASYERELQQYIYALTRNDSFAMEEIYQNTMLSALRGICGLREEKKIKDWIFAIAREEAKRYYAALTADKAGRQHVPEHELKSNLSGIIDFTQSVEDRVSIAALINSLKEEERQLYVLHYYYGFPFKKISEMLNMNYNTVRSMHGRGMAKMRRRL